MISTQTAQKQTGKWWHATSISVSWPGRISYRRTENVFPSLMNKPGKVLSFWCEFLQNLYKSTPLKTKNHRLGSSSPPTIKLQVRCCFNQLLCIPNTSQQPAENPKTVLWKFGNSWWITSFKGSPCVLEFGMPSFFRKASSPTPLTQPDRGRPPPARNSHRP